MTAEGWRCPQCGRVYAPWVYSCRDCPGMSTTNWSTWTYPAASKSLAKAHDHCPGPRGYPGVTLGGWIEHFMRWHDVPDGFRHRIVGTTPSGPFSPETFDRDAHALLDEMRREAGS